MSDDEKVNVSQDEDCQDEKTMSLSLLDLPIEVSWKIIFNSLF